MFGAYGPIGWQPVSHLNDYGARTGNLEQNLTSMSKTAIQSSHHTPCLSSHNQVLIPLEKNYRTDSQGTYLNFILFHISSTILFIISFQNAQVSHLAFSYLSISVLKILSVFCFRTASRGKQNRMTMLGIIH